MSYLVRIRGAAQADGDQLADYIAQDSLEEAIRFYMAVEKTIHEIAENPLSWAAFESSEPRLTGLRKRTVIGFPNHLIFYRITDEV